LTKPEIRRVRGAGLFPPVGHSLKSRQWIDKNKLWMMKEGQMKQSISLVRAIAMAAVLIVLASALPAFAEETNPCVKDFKQYCSHVTPGGGRLVQCYEQYKDKMSAACKDWAERVKANAAVTKEACSKEIDLSCNSEKGDPLEMLDCLQGNYIHLSPECVEALNQFKWRYPVKAK
jgi:hypothetical protein